MKTCEGCGKKREKGYHQDPSTGRSTTLFWCDECYENGHARAVRDASPSYDKRRKPHAS